MNNSYIDNIILNDKKSIKTVSRTYKSYNNNKKDLNRNRLLYKDSFNVYNYFLRYNSTYSLNLIRKMIVDAIESDYKNINNFDIFNIHRKDDVSLDIFGVGPIGFDDIHFQLFVSFGDDRTPYLSIKYIDHLDNKEVVKVVFNLKYLKYCVTINKDILYNKIQSLYKEYYINIPKDYNNYLIKRAKEDNIIESPDNLYLSKGVIIEDNIIDDTSPVFTLEFASLSESEILFILDSINNLVYNKNKED